MSSAPSAKITAPRTYSPLLLLALIVAGLAGNYIKFPIFLNIDFLFGSVFAMLALQFFGRGRGGLAAALIASYTYVLWNHPYAIIIMTAEVLVVGWLMERRKMGMVLADTLYWLLLGMPLVYLFYHGVMHVPPSNTYIVMTKQAMNGIANALLARLFFTAYSIHKRSALTSYREIVYNMLVFFVLGPALIILVMGSRADFNALDNTIRSSLIQDVQHERQRLEAWVANRRAPIQFLADMAASKPSQQMQSHLEQAMKSDVNFLRAGLQDKGATTVAYFPLRDELGQNNIGKNFADRPFIPQLKKTLQPMLSEVVLGKVGIPRPIVIVLAPVVRGGAYDGYVAGILSLEQMRAILESGRNTESSRYTLLDNNGNVIMTNRDDQAIMRPFVRGAGSLQRLDEKVSQWLPALPPNTPVSERWKNSSYVTELSVGNLAEWKLILEQPVAPYQKMLYENLTGKLTLLFLVLLVSLTLAEYFSRKFASTLGTLRTLTSDLPSRLARNDRDISWPVTGVTEVHQLVDNFRDMSDSLSEQFIEIRQINASLEQRVGERTAELKESEAKHKAAYALLRMMCDNVPDMIWAKDLENRYTFANKAFCTKLLNAVDTEEPIGKTDMFFAERERRLHADNPEWHTFGEICRDTDDITLEAGAACQFDEYGNVQGAFLFLDVHKAPFLDDNGTMIGTVGSGRDVTVAKELEQKLRKSEAEFREVLENSLDASYKRNLRTNCYDYLSPVMTRISGYLVDEMMNIPIESAADLMHPDDLPEIKRVIAESLTGCNDTAYQLEYRFKHKDGHYRWFQDSFIVTHAVGGEPLAMIGSVSDITTRKLAENALLASEGYLRTLLNTIPDLVWLKDTAGVYLSCNATFEQFFGAKEADIVGKTDYDFVDAELADSFRRHDQLAILAKKASRNEEWITFACDGRRVLVEAVKTPLYDATGEAIGVLGISRDITERVQAGEERLRLEQQFQQTQKLESLGVLAGGIAHDFNNILAIIMGYCSVIRMNYHTAESHIPQIENAVERAAGLCRQMLAYAGKSQFIQTQVDMTLLVDEMTKMLTSTLSKNVLINLDLSNAIPPIQGDASQIRQIVMNLIINAAEAIGDKQGEIRVSLTTRTVSAGQAETDHLGVAIVPGRYVCLEVSDNGCGMDNATRQRIFEPFFTTKFTGRGLGMSAVIGIVSAHNGALRLSSQPGHGTSFTLYLPVDISVTLEDIVQQYEEFSGAWQGQGSILLVDDEDAIRFTAGEMLKQMGFTIIEASNGREALDVYRQNPAGITMVVTDIGMPLMDGYELFRELKRCDANLPIIVSSGYGDTIVLSRLAAEDLSGLVAKPYNYEQFRDVMMAVVDGMSLK